MIPKKNSYESNLVYEYLYIEEYEPLFDNSIESIEKDKNDVERGVIIIDLL